MKCAKVFKWLSVILVIVVIVTAIGCGKKGSEEATPTPTAAPTATATPSEPTGQTGTLSDVVGDVQVLRSWASSWIVATSGMKIGTGDSLKTGSDGYVLITFFDGSVMEVNSSTEIAVEELSVATGGSTAVHINQVIGNTVNRVQNLVDSSSTYEVETLAGSVVVRGTIVVIQVDENGRTIISVVDEGDEEKHFVYVTAGGVTVILYEGMTLVIEPGGIPGPPFYTDPLDDPNQYNTGDGINGGGGGGGSAGPTEHCYDCPTYDSGPYTPDEHYCENPEPKNPGYISDSFTAGGCRWYLFDLSQYHYYIFTTQSYCGGSYSLGTPVTALYDSECHLIQNNNTDRGSYLAFECDDPGYYYLKIWEENGGALGYTLAYYEIPQ